MIHLVLLLVCILSIEVFIKLNFLSLLESIFEAIKKVIYVIPQNNISDHWKGKVVPAYALKIMKYSFQILLILLAIIFFFIISDFLLDSFLAFTFSLMGILESVVFAFGYLYLRKSLFQ